MRLDPLARLIESADFVGFREISLHYLAIRGFREVQLKDGWNDGGSDFAVGVFGNNDLPLGVQISVQRQDWKAKVKSSARRAKTELGLTQFWYITSRRLAQLEFNDVADELLAQDGINVRAVDSQAMASSFFESNASDFVLRSLGVSPEARRPDPVPRPDLREDAAYAFAFFGEVTTKFRTAVAEQAVLGYITQVHETRTREAVTEEVRQALQLQDDQATIISSAIDRMLQDGRVVLEGGELVASTEQENAFRTVRALREKEWQDLSHLVSNYLGERNVVGKSLETAHNAVMQSAGALFLNAASSAGAMLNFEMDASPLRQQWRKKVREVAAALEAAGLTGSLDHDLASIAKLVTNSAIGRHLMTGELFVSLVSMQSGEFQKALGASEGIQIFLDASVAIPMLSGLLFEPGSQRFLRAAYGVFDLACARGISLHLPDVYLEETASHLISAYDRYAPLIGKDADLELSTNAFVAHFSDLSRRGRLTISFLEYVESLGYVVEPPKRPFRDRRNGVVRRMEPLFARYGIEIVGLRPISRDAVDYAQQAVTFTASELGLNRSGRLLEHDAATIGYFVDKSHISEYARLFCTWDSLHLRLRTQEGKAQWQALDPAMMSDVLVLSQVDDGTDLLGTVNLALEMGEEESQRGADVLDGLVRIENDGLHDAELLRLATEFKEAYMQSMRAGATPEDLATAWEAWKGGNRSLALPDSDESP